MDFYKKRQNQYPLTLFGNSQKDPKTATFKKHSQIHQINDYQYDETNLIGEGFTSKVYIAHSIKEEFNKYAIKVIDKRKIKNDKDNLQLLKNEIEIHKNLNHDNIVKCYQAIQKGSFYYLVMEYCPHGSLESLIAKFGKIKQSEALGIMEQILSGYRYLLRQQVIHRDLKPPNILKNGLKWKICDFGFSIKGKKTYCPELNVGTPQYMAPQSLERTVYSAKSDFYALGVIFYEMMHGKTPWAIKDQKKLLKKMMEDKMEYEKLSDLKHENMKILIVRCLEPEQKDRIDIVQFQNFSFSNTEQSNQFLKKRLGKYGGKKPQSFVSSKTDRMKKEKSMLVFPKSEQYISKKDNTQDITLKNNFNDKLFKENTQILDKQLNIVQIMIALMKNSRYMLFEEADDKQLYLTTFYKHVNYILKRINSKNNYMDFKAWKQYRTSDGYLKKTKVAEQLQKQVQIYMTEQIKSIKVIRALNKRYDGLTYELKLPQKCLQNLYQYFKHQLLRLYEKYLAIDINYMLQNKWTIQNLDYLFSYCMYVRSQINVEDYLSKTLKKHSKFEKKTIIYNFQNSVMDKYDYLEIKGKVKDIRKMD